MIIECATCPVQGVRCDGCVVTALAGLPVVPVVAGGPAAAAKAEGGLPLDAAERRAVEAFVRAGLIDGGYAGSLRARVEPHTWRRRASG